MVPSFLVTTNEELRNLAKKLPSEKIVIKPKSGIMGKGVQIRSKDNLPIIRSRKLVQRFIDTSKGIKELNITGVHDFRVIVLSGKILHAYVRKPKEGLVANIALGGTVTHVDRVPNKVKKIIKNIDDKLSKYGPRVYSADFLYENGTNPILSELESTPVIDSAYKSPSSKNKQRAFIQAIINELVKLIK
jgi:glutathione synthase/RimK-type ligase-like ATP-grasp enzyme